MTRDIHTYDDDWRRREADALRAQAEELDPDSDREWGRVTIALLLFVGAVSGISSLVTLLIWGLLS